MGIALRTPQQRQEQAYQTDESTQSDTPFPEYALTKKNICQVANKLFKSRQNRKSTIKGKEKHKLILQEPNEYDNAELFDTATQIF